MMIVLGLGVLLFGKNLPSVGRQIGKGMLEFKNGMSGIGDDDSPRTRTVEQTVNNDEEYAHEPASSKFEPPA